MSVVITGLGAVTPLGIGLEASWRRLLSGASGVRATPADWPTASRVHAPLPDEDADGSGAWCADDWLPPRDQKRNDRFIHFALAASAEALRDAGWPAVDADPHRTGVILASGIGGWQAQSAMIEQVLAGRAGRLSPFTVPAMLANTAAAQISIRNAFRGPLGTPVTACAAGLQAVIDGARLITQGEADVMLVGGAEAGLSLSLQAAFDAARSLSTRDPAEAALASRPFAVDRDGFVPAEGAACLVIESEAHARRRGARVLARIAGYGTTSDAFHMTAPPPNGDGAARAMALALERSNVPRVDAVLAHATSTQAGDRAEALALYGVLGASCPPVAATKAATGHLLGAAGALAAAWAVRALKQQCLPPNRNLHNVDPELPDLRYVGPQAIAAPLDAVLVNAFGFGGVNASAVIVRP